MEFKVFKEKPSSTEEGSILSALWRKIITDMGLESRIQYMIGLYLNKDNSDTLPSKKKSKSAIMADILSDNMSWKVFLNLLFNVLKIKGFTISITIKHGNNTTTQHSVDVFDQKFKDSTASK